MLTLTIIFVRQTTIRNELCSDRSTCDTRFQFRRSKALPLVREEPRTRGGSATVLRAPNARVRDRKSTDPLMHLARQR